MSRIFISYRREDSAGHTGRLNDRLTTRFGRESIFMDIDTIPPGVDFVEAIKQAVISCDVLVAVIGRQWLSHGTGEAAQRGTDHKDFVRVEIATGLEKHIKIIPVLVQGATMPAEDHLPEDLKALARVNALELSDARWSHDTDHLIETIQKALKPTQTILKRRSLAKVVALILVLGISGSGIYFVSGGLEPLHQKLTVYRTEGKIHDARKQLNLMSIPYNADELVARAERGDTHAVSLLLDAGIDPNARNWQGLPALTEAAWAGKRSVVEALLARGADANIWDNGRWNALMRAAANGHTEIVKTLLAKGADVNAKGDRGATALMRALRNDKHDTTMALLAGGADVNLQDSDGETALMEAAVNGDKKLVSTLLAGSADPNAQMEKYLAGRTALMNAAFHGHVEVVNILLEHGANPNLNEKDGTTALIYAARYGKTAVVESLLAKGADLNATRTDGATALTEARKNGSQEMITLLTKAGASNLR